MDEILSLLGGGDGLQLDIGGFFSDILHTLLGIGSEYASTYGVAMLFCIIAGIGYKIWWSKKISKEIYPDEWAPLDAEIKEKKKEYNSRDHQLEDAEQDLDDTYKPQIRRLKRQVEDLDREIKTKEKSLVVDLSGRDQEFSELQAERDRLDDILHNLRREYEEKNEDIERENSKLARFDRRLKEKKELLKELKEKKKRKVNWKMLGIYTARFLIAPVAVGATTTNFSEGFQNFISTFFSGFGMGLIAFIAAFVFSGRVADKFKSEYKKAEFWVKLVALAIIILAAIADPLTGFLFAIGWILIRVLQTAAKKYLF